MSGAATQFGVVSAALSMVFGTAEAVRRILKWHRKRLRERKRFRDIGVATEDIAAAVEEECGIADGLESCPYYPSVRKRAGFSGISEFMQDEKLGVIEPGLMAVLSAGKSPVNYELIS